MIILLIIVIIAFKFILPSLMLFNPLIGMWSNYFLDIIDGDILLSLGLTEIQYQTIDKLADFFSYIIMLITVYKFNWKIKKTATILFIYRAIGQSLFFLTGKEIMFFYFQNFLEPLLLIYTILILIKKSSQKAHHFYKKHLLIIWAIILIYKIWNEWYLHFANIDLSSIFFGWSG